jgi:molecular chaperone GrpE
MSESETDSENGEGDVPVEVDSEGDRTTRVPDKQAEGDPAAQLQDQLALVEKEKKDVYDRLLRTAADFDNFRKRSRKDMDDARVKAREDVLKEILPGIDNLERAIGAANDPNAGVSSVVDGIKLVLRQFQSALERFEVKGFQSVGQPFDPGRHEAISQLESSEHPPGVIAAEMQRGYTIGSRLLRPALVAVAKAPASAPPESASEESDK